MAFVWNRMDAWFEEDEEVFFHARDPYKRVDCLPSSRHIKVSIDGEVLAETNRPVLLFETGLITRYYIPRLDVRQELLRPTEKATRCPYKGRAAYYSVEAGGKVHDDIAWWYPTAPVSELAAMLAEDHEGWEDGDLEMVEGWEEPVVSDAAWERVVHEKERELRRLVASGALTGRGKGADLTIQQGAFNAHFGRTMAPCLEDGLRYRVLPDSDADAVEVERIQLAQLREAIDARRLVLKDEEVSTRVLDVLAGHLKNSLAVAYANLQQAWQQANGSPFLSRLAPSSWWCRASTWERRRISTRCLSASGSMRRASGRSFATT